MITVEEVEDLNIKLLSDKAKIREEGCKELNVYLETTGPHGLCALLDKETSKLQDEDRITSSTWPGVLHALCQCVAIESKKKAPKPVFAKTLRMFIYKAEDNHRTGGNLFLLRKVKRLFQHIYDTLRDVPSFLLDYGQILCQLLPIPEYRLRISKKVYGDLVLLFLKKAKFIAHGTSPELGTAKEEAFRSTLTLLCLLQYPPKDFPDFLRTDTATGFVDIFLHLRDEGRIAKKLLASLNVVLFNDGPNLGDLLVDIHSSVRRFMVRTWITTRDRELKESLVLYLRCQLKLRKIIRQDDGTFLQELWELVEKDLEQGNLLLVGSHRYDGREEKSGTLTRGLRSFLKLVAAILYEVLTRHEARPLPQAKRRKKEDISTRLRDGIASAKCLWLGSLCLLMREHGGEISRAMLVDFLNGLLSSLERVFSEGLNNRSFDALVWTLRCLQELSIIWPTGIGDKGGVQSFHADGISWQLVWDFMLRWLSVINAVPIVLDEMLRLLGHLVLKGIVRSCNLPHMVWELQYFSDRPSRSGFYFVGAVSVAHESQMGVLSNLELRKQLLTWSLGTLEYEDGGRAKGNNVRVTPTMFSSLVMILATGSICIQHLVGASETFIESMMKELGDWSEAEDQEKFQESDLLLLDHSENLLASCGNMGMSKRFKAPLRLNNFVAADSDILLQALADCFIASVSKLMHGSQEQLLPRILYLAIVISHCICGVNGLVQNRTAPLSDWSEGGVVWQNLALALQHCKSSFENVLQSFDNDDSQMSVSSILSQIPPSVSLMSEFVATPCNCILITEESKASTTKTSILESLLYTLSNLISSPGVARELHQNSNCLLATPSSRNINESISLIDVDLDAEVESLSIHVSAAAESFDSFMAATSTKNDSWKVSCVSMVVAMAKCLPETTFNVLSSLLLGNHDKEVHNELVLGACNAICDSTLHHLPKIVELIVQISEDCLNPEASYSQVLDAISILLSSISKVNGCKSTLQGYGDLVKLIERMANMGLSVWHTRIKLADAISKFIVVDPGAAQVLTEKLLSLLHDPEFRVRLGVACKVPLLFDTWNGHEDLLQDICSNVGTKLPMATKLKTISAAEVCQPGAVQGTFADTALITLGQVAISSEHAESEAVFMICAAAALYPGQRCLVAAVLDMLAKHLGYATRGKYLEQLLAGVLSRWVTAAMPLPALVEIRDIIAGKLDSKEFLTSCTPFLIPNLLLNTRDDELQWLARATSKSVSSLLRENFTSIFSALLPLHCCGCPRDQEKASTVLQGSMLSCTGMSEDERDNLIERHMVSIVGGLFQLCSGDDMPEKPFFPKDAVITSVRTVVDGFLEVDQLSEDGGVIDKMQVFRADRIFQLLLQMHHQIDAACHPRHRHHCLSRLGAILTVVHKRAIVPSTSRYFIHIVLQSIEVPELQDLCCSLLSDLMRKLEQYSSGTFVWVLGNQLQSIVSRLVSCCIDEACDSDCGMSSVVDRPIAGKIRKSQQRHMKRPSSAVLSLLHNITVGAHPSLHPYIQNLDPFPEYQPFEPMKKLQAELCSGRTLEDEFVQFVQRAPQLPPQLRLRSLQRICDQLRNRKSDMLSYKDGDVRDGWQSSAKVGEAVWKLVKFCDEQDDYDMRDITGELLATVGIANADEVVFHLPGESKISGLLTAYFGHSVDNVEGGLSDDVVKAILLQLNGFLLDNSVSIIELASRSIKGVLSTEKGYRVFNLLDAQEKAYLETHAKGINLRVVEDMVNKIREDSSKKTTGLDDPLLWDTSGKTYEAWICSLVNSLVERTEDSILRLCQPLVLSKVGLAELVLPHTLACLLSRSSKDSQIFKAISSQVEKTVFAESNKSTRSIQIFLEAMNCLRRSYVLNKMNPPAVPSRRQENLKGAGTRQSNGGSENVDNLQTELAWPKVYWLDIDYLVVAKAAQQCAAFFTSILYLEHWCEEKFGKLTLGQLDFCNNLDSKLPAHMELLLHAYSEINEPDGLYGVLQSHKLISQLRMHEHEGNWDKALGCYDLLLGMPSNCENKSLVTQYHIGILRSLRQIGCFHVQAMYWNGLIDQDKHLINDSEFKELQYEAAWRAGTWDFKGSRADMSTQDLGINYHENLHSCLKSLAEGSAEVFNSQIKKVKQDLVSHIIDTSMESTRNVHPQIVKLQIIDCLSQAWGIRWSSQASSYDHIPTVPLHAKMKFFYETWQQMVKKTRTIFDLYEPFATFLCVLYKLLGQSDFLHQQLLQLASFSRKAGKLNQAAAAVHELKQIYEGSTAENAIAVEEAKLLWAQEQQEMAVNLIKYILQLKTGSCSDTVYCLAGKWLAKTRSATSKTILESYFKRAVEMAEADPKNMILSRKRICKSHFHLAHYADSLYKSYEDRFSSSEWQSALRLRHLKSKELEALARRLKMATKDDKRDYAMKIVELQKQIALDAEEENRLQNDKEYFLKVALQGYRCCLMSGDKYDIRVVFRLVSLWFNLTMNPRVVEDMFLTVEKVQSFKFLPLVYQIASRMGTPKEKKHYDFQYVVTSLVKKMAIEHPFHSLYQVFALSNGDRIKDKQRSKSAFVFDLDKKHAAERIIKELSSHYPVLLEQIKQMIEIYIKLAELETDKQDINKRLTIPRDIRSIRQLELVPVITANIPIDPSCQYMQGTFPSFKGLSDKISVMNGVNAPKVIECLGSDGNKYRQLAKSGNDDLRQDAVMEQLFCLVNALLLDHPDTRRRHLRIRTYKVIPFTPSAGVLEWVDGTVPLGEYLLGSSRTGGAHGRYGIGDWTYMKCREQMTTEKDKRKAYHNVCQNFRPVMHYFFLEMFSQPADWFEKRLAYTRSVAASSMVGYIIGLGDRHSMNILIDQVTAEVVHIDLGVAFEQGLMLKTPERVPFRLTRDIIDGMGISGVEGVFRRCCEETLAVMRSNKEALLTIVEVFIHDPLYKWALSPLKALQRQKETEDVDEDSSELGSSDDNMEGNKDATRAQMRVKQKLDGYEDGELRSLKGQVQQLLQDAQDPERLSQMFPGWGAWL